MEYLDQETVLRYLGYAFAFKLLFSAAVETKNGVCGYLLPRLWSLCCGKEDFASKYGEWGLVTGCTQVKSLKKFENYKISIFFRCLTYRALAGSTPWSWPPGA